jgi:hypothetical protein
VLNSASKDEPAEEHCGIFCETFRCVQAAAATKVLHPRSSDRDGDTDDNRSFRFHRSTDRISYTTQISEVWEIIAVDFFHRIAIFY